MNNNFRMKPKLIDVNLLNKVNKIYINKSGGNHFILDWIYKTLYPCFRDNLLFSLVVFGLVTYLLYRYFENIKKKNKIISNINDNKPIEVQLKKPINYNNVETMENTEKSNISNLSNELSEINNSQKNNDQSFDKDIERELKIGENNNRQPKSNTRKAMIPNKPATPPNIREQPPAKQQQPREQQPGEQQPRKQQQKHDQQYSEHESAFSDQQTPRKQQQSEEYVSNTLMEPNMPFEVLERNMNRMKGRSADGNIPPKCSNYRIPITNEPAANTYSDNFYEF
jgi:hypothetical protein